MAGPCMVWWRFALCKAMPTDKTPGQAPIRLFGTTSLGP